ncbi:MAG: fibronectin type III-like domain-contianing protein, partial [Myxococcota bacterium]
VASLVVTNEGDRTGAEVVQAYLGVENSAVERAVRALKAFRRVQLRAGESRRITLRIPRERFAYFDEGRDAFVVETTAHYRLEVGRHAGDEHALGAEFSLAAPR